MHPPRARCEVSHVASLAAWPRWRVASLARSSLGAWLARHVASLARLNEPAVGTRLARPPRHDRPASLVSAPTDTAGLPHCKTAITVNGASADRRVTSI